MQLTKKTMMIKITNMLTRSEHVMKVNGYILFLIVVFILVFNVFGWLILFHYIQVCQEETVADIRNRYMEYNLNSNSYTWKVISFLIVNNARNQPLFKLLCICFLKALVDGTDFVALRLDETLEANGENTLLF